jgi:N4-(beta-N-acetylglucosaminyl)-L-asparaginase
MIMDGDTSNSGAVAGLRRVRDAISVARHVMDYTAHSLLAGDLATQFAVENGFREDDLTTNGSAAVCEAWKAGGCQPNYRVNVTPDATSGCGPYAPNSQDGIGIAARHAVNHGLVSQSPIGPPHSHGSHGSRPRSHDTISMVTIHASGSMASGTSTNGASHKVPGRVGDGPIVGSGSYVDSFVGGCGATGDGDVMMRFLPCYQAVENLRRGMTPTRAAEDAVSRMLRKFPQIQTGVVVVDKEGNHGGAGSGWTFTYAFRGGGMNGTEVVEVPPLSV